MSVPLFPQASHSDLPSTGTCRRVLTILFGAWTLVSRLLAAEAALDHFSWGPVESPQGIGTPINTTLTACDSAGQTVTNYSGNVAVSAQIWSVPPLIISEVDNERYSAVEFTNPSRDPVDISGWQTAFYDVIHWPQPTGIFVFPPGTICPPQSVFIIAQGGDLPGIYPRFSAGALLDASQWNPNPIAICLLDRTNRVMDFFCTAAVDPYLITNPVTIGRFDWVGKPVPNPRSFARLERQGSFNHRQAIDWVEVFHWFPDPPSLGVLNSGLNLPFAANYAPIAMSPGTVNLSNGVWSGFISIGASGSNVILHADDGNGHPGNSDAFAVLSPSVVMTLPPLTSSTQPGIHSATIAICRAMDFEVVFNLASDARSKIVVPATVVIPAGASSVGFNLTNLNDSLLDGIRYVKITASNDLFPRAEGFITNVSAPVDLQLALPTESIMQGATITNQVRLSIRVPLNSELQAELHSSDPLLLEVPSNVHIPPGQTSANFILSAPIRADILGNHLITVTAFAGPDAYASGSVTVAGKQDQDLTLILPERLTEASGATIAAKIIIPGCLQTNLVVNLESSDSSLLQILSSATLPAGQTSTVARLIISSWDSPRFNQRLTVRALAPGFTDASDAVLIQDSHLDHFEFDAIPLAQSANQPFGVSILARNKSGDALKDFAGVASLSVTGLGLDSMAPPQADGFTNGQWRGNVVINTTATNAVLCAQSGPASGLSNPFNVQTLSIVTLAATVGDLVYDPGTDRIYATVPATAAVDSNTVMRLDPYSATVEAFLPVDTGPGLMALSASNQFIFLIVQNGSSVQRLNLASQTAELEFALPPDSPYYYAVELIGLPDAPSSVAVAGESPFGFWQDFIYDADVTRTDLGDLALVPGFRSGGVLKAGKMYLSDGTVFSTTTQLPVGQFAVPGKLGRGAPALEPGANRVYVLTQSGDQTAIYSCDSETFIAEGCQIIPGVIGTPGHLVRWGSDGLAFSTSGGQVFLIHSPLCPRSGAAELALFQEGPVVGTPGTDIVYTITITNASGVIAPDVTVADILPVGATLVSASSSRGTFQNQNGVLAGTLGAMPPQSAASLVVTVQPQREGFLSNVVAIAATSDPRNLAHKQSAWLTTVGSSSGATSIAQLLVKANDLVYNSADGMLYASVAGADPAFANRIVAVDPRSLQPGPSIAIGSEPGALALSPDGRYLYVYLQASATIEQIDLQTDAVAFQDSIYSFALTDMTVLGDQAQSLLLSQHYRYGDPSGRGLKLISNGIPSNLNLAPDIALVQPSLFPTVFYGYNNAVIRVQLDGTNGIVTSAASLTYDWEPEMKCDGGLLFFSWGEVVDPESMVRVGSFPGLPQSTNHICPDLASGRVYYLSFDGVVATIGAYSLNGYALRGTEVVTGIAGVPQQLVRWGSTGLAFTTSGGQLFSVQTTLVPTNPPADLVVTQSAAGTTSLLADYPISVIVSNQGPGIATGITMQNFLPARMRFISASASQGSVSSLSGMLLTQLGTLAPGASARISILLRPNSPGSFSSYVCVAANEPDPGMLDNRSALSGLVQFYEQIALSIGDMVYGPSRGKLFATVLSTGAFSNSIVQIDPQTGNVEQSLRTDFEPGRIAITSNAQFLYVLPTSLDAIVRLDVQAWTNDLRFDLRLATESVAFVAGDFATLPNQPHAIAVSMYAWYGRFITPTVIFDDGIQRPDFVELAMGPDTRDPFHIRSSSDGSTLYALNGTLTSYGIDSSGLSGPLTTVPGFVGGFQIEEPWLVTEKGHAFDLRNSVDLGSFPAAGLVAPAFEDGLVFFLAQGRPAGRPPFILTACSTNMTNVLWQMPIPEGTGLARRLTRCGAGTLAFATANNPLDWFPNGGQLFFLHPSLLPPAGDLLLEAATNWAFAGDNLTNTFTILNDGPFNMTGVTFSNLLAPGSALVLARSTQGACVETNGLIRCDVGALTASSRVTITVVSTATAPGVVPVEASVFHNELDIDPANNHIASSERIYPFPSVTVGNLSVPRQLGATADFTVRLDAPSPQPVTLYCYTTSGTARSHFDYEQAKRTITFEPGSTAKSVRVIILDDGQVKSNLVFYLNVGFNSWSAPLASASCTLMERNLHGLSAADLSLTMVPGGITNALFNIHLSGSNAEPSRVDYFTQDGNAIAGRDYLGKSGTLVFPPGVTDTFVSIPVYSIANSTGVKTFYLCLANPVSAALYTTQAAASILNSSERLSLLISGLAVNGRDVILEFSGAAGAFYRLEMSHDLPAQNWTTVLDYIPGTGEATFITNTNGLSDVAKFYRLLELP